MFDVITLGSATIDMFAVTKSKLIKIMDSKGETDLLAFSTGTKLLIDELHYTLGGGGTNTAAALAEMGFKVAFLGKTGDGHKGKHIRYFLKMHNVNISLLKKGREHSGVSIILDNIERDRVILAHKGVNNCLRMRDVKLSRLKTRWIYSSSLVGESFETLKKVVSYARKNKIKVAFNPSSYMTDKGMPYLKPILENTDVLIFNRHEAELLTKEEKMTEIFRKLLSSGPEIVAITDGKNGVYAADREHMYHARAKKVKVVDSTGAGDAFAASFVAGLIKKKDISFSLKLGIENASSTIRSVGAKNGLLTWRKAVMKVNANKSKVKKSRLYKS